MPFMGLPTPSEAVREKFLKENVGWCVAPRRNEIFRSLSLANIVYECQHHISIPSEYRIDKASSSAFLEDIIEDFKDYLVDRYFNDNLSYSPSFSALTKEEYFLYEFESYLSKEIVKLEFVGRTMAIEKDRVNYGSWGLSQHFSAKHHLTDDGVLYAKFFYIVTLSCSKSYNIVRVHGKYRPEIAKEYVDTRIVSVSCG